MGHSEAVASFLPKKDINKKTLKTHPRRRTGPGPAATPGKGARGGLPQRRRRRGARTTTMVVSVAKNNVRSRYGRGWVNGKFFRQHFRRPHIFAESKKRS